MNIILFNQEEKSLPFSDKRVQHILKVLHLKEKDTFSAGFINGKKGKATIKKIDEEKMTFSFDFDTEPPFVPELTLLVAQVRPICMKRILRETVSLGIKRLILTVSDLGEKSYLSSSLYQSDEYKEIMLDGAMQAGETLLPECHIVKSVKEADRFCYGRKLLLDNVVGAEELINLDLELSPLTLAIGPERGWSDAEREYFLLSGYEAVLIGKRILRTETAVVAATAITLSKMLNL